MEAILRGRTARLLPATEVRQQVRPGNRESWAQHSASYMILGKSSLPAVEERLHRCFPLPSSPCSGMLPTHSTL